MRYFVILKNGAKQVFTNHREMIEFCTINSVSGVYGGYYGNIPKN